MPRLKVNRKLEPFLRVPKPIKVAIGGRGSGKSIGFGDVFTMKMQTEAADIYCLREFQDTVQDSVHRVFKDSIEKRLGLSGWDVQQNTIVSPGGSKTTYKGANRNPDSMQSAQGYKYSWFEEAHRASKASLDKLLPTIIRNPGAECWFSGNPQSSLDPFSQRFIVPYLDALDRDGYYEDDIHLIIVVNWRDNPWWNDEQEALRTWDFENRPRAEYDWIWEGKFYDGVEDAIVKPDWFDAAIDAHTKLGFKPQGVKAIGFDPDDSDTGDGKGLVVRHGSVITRIDSWTRGEVDDATHRAYETAEETRTRILVYDAVGIGAGAKVAFKQKDPTKEIKIEAFKGSFAVRYPERRYPDDDIDGQINEDTFRNLRAQYYWYLRDRFFNTYQAVVNGKYIDPDKLISIDSSCEHIALLRAEICRIRRKRTSMTASSFIQIESKDDMKRRDMPSPNLADAAMMAFANADVAAMNDKYSNWDMPVNY